MSNNTERTNEKTNEDPIDLPDAESIAYLHAIFNHEAGHAVMAVYCGGTIS